MKALDMIHYCYFPTMLAGSLMQELSCALGMEGSEYHSSSLDNQIRRPIPELGTSQELLLNLFASVTLKGLVVYSEIVLEPPSKIFGACTISLINASDYCCMMNSRSAFAISLSIVMLLGFTVAPSRNAFAHTFSGDEGASFLATVEVIKVQLDLVKNDFATNATMATEHAEHAREHLTSDTIKEITEKNERLGTELPASLDELHEALENGTATAADVDAQVATINDLLGETVAVRIENAQLTNSTVQGTMLANFVDDILESYGGAYGVEVEGHEEDEEGEHQEGSMDEGSMSSNSTTPTEEELEELTTFELAEKYPSYVNEGEGDDSATDGEEGENGNQNHTTIVNMMEYESAQALAARAQELFDTKLKALAVANTTDAVAALDSGLDNLKEAIDAKAPLEDVDVIVHTEIHPNIQEAFNLQIIPEFPLPILAVIMGIMGAVAYSRLNGRKWQ
jgi:hypothetical protein